MATLLPSPSSACCGAALQHSSTKKAIAVVVVCSEAALQRSSTKKVTAVAIAFFCLLRSCATAQLHKEGDGSCHRLLLSGAELHCGTAPWKRWWQLQSPSSVCCRVALRHSPMKKVTATAITFFSLLRSCATAQKKKATLLWSCVALQRSAAKQKTVVTLPSPSFLSSEAALQSNVTKKAMAVAITFFFFCFAFVFFPVEHSKEGCNFVSKKKKTTAAATFFALLQGNGKFAFLLWFCCKEGDGNNVVTFLYGGKFYFFFVVTYGVVP